MGETLWQKKEFALIYFAGYLAIALLGSGKFSVDGYLNKT